MHVAIIMLMAALGAQAEASRAAAAESSPERIAWAALDDRWRTQAIALLESGDWPIRVFGLLRLQRYEGREVDELIESMVRDTAWQVRCFALDQARLRSIEVPPEALEGEREPRVLRTALRCGVALDEAAIEKAATRLLNTRAVDELLLGMELAAAANSEPLRLDASKRASRLIRNMDSSVAAIVSRRLARVLSAEPGPRTVQEWHDWLSRQREPLALAKPGRSAMPVEDRRTLIAELDDETFARLLDYLGSLRRRELELAIVIDSTMSMAPMIDQARAGVDSLILFLRDISRQMRLAIVAYRDHDNPPLWSGQPLTSDIDSVRKFLFGVRISGGRDYPEAVLAGLEACLKLEWNRQAERQIVLVGDAPPHDEDIYRARAVLEALRNRGVIMHAAHVPMEYPRGYYENMNLAQAQAARDWITQYNRSTGEIFAELADVGGGRVTTMSDPESLVPSIMRFTFEEAWWPVFDEFYAMYVELCR